MKANFGGRGFSIGLNANRIMAVVAWLAVPFLPSLLLRAETPEPVVFTQSAPAIGVYDVIEVTAAVRAPSVRNPFLEGALTGDFEPAGSVPGTAIEGFCDSTNGSRYRIRFMPSKAGSYTFHVTLKVGQESRIYSGQFTATDEHWRGPLRIDPDYPLNGFLANHTEEIWHPLAIITAPFDQPVSDSSSARTQSPNHQGLDNVIPFPDARTGGHAGILRKSERLGGLLTSIIAPPPDRLLSAMTRRFAVRLS
jgi:hypothetical protein